MTTVSKDTAVPRDYVRAFAVVRIDLDLLAMQPELSVKVVKVLPDEEAAVAEVARLNQLNGGKKSNYFLNATRWYPRGRAPDVPPGPAGTGTADHV